MNLRANCLPIYFPVLYSQIHFLGFMRKRCTKLNFGAQCTQWSGFATSCTQDVWDMLAHRNANFTAVLWDNDWFDTLIGLPWKIGIPQTVPPGPYILNHMNSSGMYTSELGWKMWTSSEYIGLRLLTPHNVLVLQPYWNTDVSSLKLVFQPWWNICTIPETGIIFNLSEIYGPSLKLIYQP